MSGEKDAKELFEKVRDDAEGNLNKFFLTLSTASLGVTITVSSQLNEVPLCVGLLLIIGWFLFAVAIGLTLLSFFKSIKMCDLGLEGKMDEAEKANKATHTLNVLIAIILMCGIIFSGLGFAVNIL